MEERIRAELAILALDKEKALAQLNAILCAEQALQKLLEPQDGETRREVAAQ